MTHWRESELGDFHSSQHEILWRVVETQEIAATKSITTSAADQSLLESILDNSKPTVPADCDGLSYLLSTPFRYPPLDYGSRFGDTFERGIFYASTSYQCAFAETAVYLWLFQQGPEDTGPLACIRDHRTLFSITVQSDKALALCDEPLSGWSNEISNPVDWSEAQAFGRMARMAGSDFILYQSARLRAGVNAAVINPVSFQNTKPESQQHWQLELNDSTCWFGMRGESVEFRRDDFEKGGRIPHPCL